MSAGNVPTGVDAIASHSYTYDALDRLLTASAGGVDVTRTYDSFGRLRKEKTHGDTLEVAYADLAGTLTRTWPDGREETLSTNLNGVVTQVERTAAGTLGAGRAILGEFTPYGPGALGKAEFFVDPNAATTHFVETHAAYDERKRITKLEHLSGATTLESIHYRYDTLDRRRIEMLGSGTVQARLHGFDTKDRLIQTEEESSSFSLTSVIYTQADHDSDISAIETAMSSLSPTTYEYLFSSATGGKADERLTYKKTPSGGTTTTTNYTYEAGHRIDDAGTEDVEHYTDGTRKKNISSTYEIDALGRIVRVKNLSGSQTRATIDYDPLGRVSSIMTQGTTRDLSYFGNQVWQEKVGSTITRQISRHPMLPGPMAMHVANETYLTLHDPRHNLLSIADSTGTVAAGNSLRYEPFGTPSVGATTSGIEPRFGGMRYLPGTQLYLSDTRLMDPRHGAWLSPDPLGYIDSPNLYAYARQNPIDFVDPSGLGTEKGKVGQNSDGGGLDDAWNWLKGAAEDVAEVGKQALRWGKNAAEDTGRFFLTDDVYDWVTPKLQLGAEFWWGATKRSFEWQMSLSPHSGAIGLYTRWKMLNEEVESGQATAYVAGVGTEALFGNEQKQEELGQIVTSMGEHFSTMSAGEWGSTIVDVGMTAPAGGVGVGRGVVSTGRRSLSVLGKVRNAIPGRTSGPVVIGENMSRVNKYAKSASIGAETIEDWLSQRGLKVSEWSQGLNDEFILDIQQQGRQVIDVGPDFRRRMQNRIRAQEGRPPSPVYGGERMQLQGYQKYEKAYVRWGRYQGGVPGLDY